MTSAGVAAIVVHYGKSAGVAESAAAISRLPGVLDVVVVDNSGNLEEMPPGVRCIAPGRNVGFGTAVNLAAASVTAPWLLLVNSDASLGAGDLAGLVEAGAIDANRAALAPRLVYPDGRPQINGGRHSGWLTELARSTELGPRLRSLRAGLRMESGGQAGFVGRPWVSAAVLLIRKSAFDDVGGFDERFFLYFEDEDLCRRVTAAGWRVGIVPRSVARHAVGGAPRGESYTSQHYAASRLAYHEKWSGRGLRAVVRLGARARVRR